MITTKQKVLLGALVPLGAAIWVPQLMARMGDDDARASIDAEAELELDYLDPSTDTMGDGLGGVTGAPPADSVDAGSAAPGDVSSPGAGSELRGTDATLAAVLRTLQGSETFGAAGASQSTSGFAGLSGAIDDGEGDESIPFTSPMVEFVEDNPLRGTVTGAVTRVALFGNFRVQEGDLLPGTAARLTSVGRGSVTVDESGFSLEVDLAPLETDPSRARATAGAAARGGDPLRAGALDELAGPAQTAAVPEPSPAPNPAGNIR